ncbi:hypothetical protein EPO34_04120 [Patescibacteria group bacterium]|nr:MAG: hypothetical protein EPO34_04120 [Patescibacteria group bacterium]
MFLKQAAEFFERFFRFGGTVPMVLKLLGDDESMEWLVKSLKERLEVNPFEQTVEEQLSAMRKQNAEGNWGISEETLAKLAESAPAWPKGRDAYRSFRIRFGEGNDGVAQTFEAHAAAMKRVHGEKLWRWELLHSGKVPYKGKDVERLKLHAGNHTHHAVVEWIIVNDLSANRKRKDVTSVRGPKSLADEGIVLAWLFPKRVQAIDYDTWCAWFCGGYESNVPEDGDEEWQGVVIVFRDTASGGVLLGARWRGNDDPDYSVPPLG